jgi:hypothetical protein
MMIFCTKNDDLQVDIFGGGGGYAAAAVQSGRIAKILDRGDGCHEDFPQASLCDRREKLSARNSGAV